MANFANIDSLEYGVRQPGDFITEMIVSSGVHSRYSVYDEVKHKQNIPIFGATLAFGTDFCTFDPQSTVSITEKEVTVKNYKWAFKNCKTALQQSYRALAMKKGANNEETMDNEFKDWVLMHFAELAGKHVGSVATTEIFAEIAGDAAVNKANGAAGSLQASKTKAGVLEVLEAAWSALPKNMYLANFGVKDAVVENEDKPMKSNLAFFLPWEVYKAAHIALASTMSLQTRQDIESGKIPLQYMGIELLVNPEQAEDKILIANPANFLTLVDDLSDVRAIQSKWVPELSSDYIWGQFTIGFSYRVSAEILEFTLKQ